MFWGGVWDRNFRDNILGKEFMELYFGDRIFRWDFGVDFGVGFWGRIMGCDFENKILEGDFGMGLLDVILKMKFWKVRCRVLGCVFIIIS